MANFIKDQLVVITQSLDGDCAMFSVQPGTLAKVVKHHAALHKVQVVVTPHDMGYITTDDLNVRDLTCREVNEAVNKFLEVPKYTFKPAMLY
jgi:hypothetical protein